MGSLPWVLYRITRCSPGAAPGSGLTDSGFRSTLVRQRQRLAAPRPLPQPHGRPPREAVDRQLAVDQADLQGVGPVPALVLVVAIAQEVDALVGRADPAPLRVGQLAHIGAVHQ